MRFVWVVRRIEQRYGYYDGDEIMGVFATKEAALAWCKANPLPKGDFYYDDPESG